MNWLRPLFLGHPDIITAAPNRILMKSSGSAPFVLRRNRANEWATDFGEGVSVDGEVSSAGAPHSSESLHACESNSGKNPAAAAEASDTDAVSQGMNPTASDDVAGALPCAFPIDVVANRQSNPDASSASDNATDYDSLASLAAEDTETRLSNTARVSTAELAKVAKKPAIEAALRLLNQRPTYSAFKWFIDTDAVSSMNQWRESVA
jgi:hypothetical protein